MLPRMLSNNLSLRRFNGMPTNAYTKGYTIKYTAYNKTDTWILNVKFVVVCSIEVVYMSNILIDTANKTNTVPKDIIILRIILFPIILIFLTDFPQTMCPDFLCLSNSFVALLQSTMIAARGMKTW